MKPRWLLAAGITAALCAPPEASPQAAPPPSESPSPAASPSAEDRAREVEKESLEEEAVDEQALEPSPSPAPVPSPPPSPEPSPSASPEPSPSPDGSPAPSPEPPVVEPSTPPALDPSPEPAPSPSPSPDIPAAASPVEPAPAPAEPSSAPAEPAPAEPAPAPVPASAPGGDAEGPTVLDKLGTFQDIEDLDLGDLLSVRSGEGGARTADDEPGSQFVVTEEDIRRSGARGVLEVLETVPGLEVVTDNMGRGRVVVRGVPGGFTSGSENILVLLNGLKLNENLTGGAFAVNLDLPVDNIKRIEVIRGPGAASFGVGAFLAVINIVTEGVDTFRRDELTLGGGSFNSFLYNFRYGTTVKEVSLAGFLQYSYTGGAHLDVASDLQTATDRALAAQGIAPASLTPGETVDDRKTADANLALAYRDFGMDIRLKKEDAGGFIGLLDVLGEHNRLNNTQVAVAARWGRALAIGDVNAKAAYSVARFQRFMDVLPAGYTQLPADRVTVVFPGGVAFQDELATRRVALEGTLSRVAGDEHLLTGGVRVERESTSDLSARTNYNFETGTARRGFEEAPGLVPDAARTILSAYVQDAWNPTARLGITGGLRLDDYTDFGTAVSPRVAAVYRARPDLVLKTSYGRAVRTPSFAERFFSLPRYVGEEDVDPSRIDAFDAGVVYRRRDLRVSATVYHMALRDVIAPDGTGLVVGSPAHVVNIEGIDTSGLELEASQSFPGNRSLHFAYGLQHPEDAATGLRLADVPTHLGRISGNLPAGQYLMVSPALSFRGSRPRAAGDPRPELEGYTLVDVIVRGRNFHPKIEVAGAVQNLFGTRYADPSPVGGLPGDYPRPGRSIFLKLKYRF
jgi:outer membrane receptor protein involved in Fe transport